MSPNTDPVFGAVPVLVAALLEAMDALGTVARHMGPANLAALLSTAGTREALLRDAVERCAASAWPELLGRVRGDLLAAADEALLAFDGLRAGITGSGGIREAYRALRHANRAEAALYPVASVLPTVSRFYLEPEARDATARLHELARADPTLNGAGVMHANGTPGERGSFSVYVPEDYDASRAYPLVMALHGGSGNGAAFLWSWLRSARTRGAIVVAPTAPGPTWALRKPEQDAVFLDRILAHARERWNIDPSRLLLTGMSDGGSFALLSGLSEASPFTHLAPAATGFHPMLREMAEPARMAGLPIYLMHGALDWMFDIGRARGVARALASAGANIVFREIADLSHTYPRDENGRILEWLGDGRPA